MSARNYSHSVWRFLPANLALAKLVCFKRASRHSKAPWTIEAAGTGVERLLQVRVYVTKTCLACLAR